MIDISLCLPNICIRLNNAECRNRLALYVSMLCINGRHSTAEKSQQTSLDSHFGRVNNAIAQVTPLTGNRQKITPEVTS